MKHTFVTLLVIALAFSLKAKNKKNPIFKQANPEVGIFFATNGKMNSVAFQACQYWNVGRNNKRFHIGLGARSTSSFGNRNILYQTAPAELTSGKNDPSVFFSPQIPENIDTLELASTQINMINLMMALQYNVYKKWGIEFSIDLAGFSFGAKKSSTLTYGEKSNAIRVTDSKPTPRNILLISDNDIGSLNSELIVTFIYKPRIKFKGGISFLFNEYTVDNPVLYTNSIGTVIGTDRYRSKSLTFGIGINYIFKHKS